jgi:hypothetical protein
LAPSPGERRPRRRRERPGRQSELREPRKESELREPRKESEPASAAPRGIIEVPEGKEFWEAWADSRGESTGPAGATAEKAPEEPIIAEGHVRLYLNLGRKDRLSPAELQSLLAERGLPETVIEMRLTHSYLVVPEDKESLYVGALAGVEHRGRALVCERARPRSSR